MTPAWAKVLIPIVLIAIGAVLVWAFSLAALEGGDRLALIALERVPESGVSNPITSVLLNFRAYDTLLEVAVLLTALLGIWSLGPAAPAFQPASPILGGMIAWVVPLLILSTGYMLWAGGHAPGGAFQAGALLGAAGVTLALGGDASAGLPGETRLRFLSVLGVLVFTAVGVILMALGYGFLTYPEGYAKWLIIFIETAATLSIGVTLAAAYLGGEPRDERTSRSAT
ncbi:sodium:proton antiporter [Thiocapsa imhoffii]|uniref:Sodium:proton antiporter n=1 Tax=Thiocapsa imhoffii TaxID=382777 RepID=A0A9X0WJ80_9GAMM|nr:MnhB domain-containing protein [Thiocapsa imhoffii]MBK1645736.1 sodium:proton antiporter [Thiocapsa imhoffii]